MHSNWTLSYRCKMNGDNGRKTHFHSVYLLLRLRMFPLDCTLCDRPLRCYRCSVVKWFVKQGTGSPAEAMLEQTPYPFQPTNLSLFGNKIALYRFNQGAHTIAWGSNRCRGTEPPSPPHFDHCRCCGP